MAETNARLTPGTIVRLKSDPGRQGLLTDKVREQAGIVKYQVLFPEGKSFQPDYELEPVLEDESDREALLEKGRFGRVRDLRRLLTHIHLSGKLANLVYSMDATNTDYYAYQYKPVLSFLESPSKGLLIADEVGLGKTIEAGLIWTELRARYDARRLLVVCPAMLREKWCDELGPRFGVNAEIVDSAGLLASLKEDRRSIPDGQALVCSMQGIRPPSDRDSDEDKKQTASARLAEFLEAQATEEPLFDLVVIDEAHYMRNPGSQTAKLGRMLRDVTENLVLLSATPINLSDDDLFYLLNLVDPDSFRVKEFFPEVLHANEHLRKARDLVLTPSAQPRDILEELVLARSQSLLKDSRQLAELMQPKIVEEACVTEAGRVRMANSLDKINLLRHSITRTRKSEVHEMRVIREPVKHFVELNPEGIERRFYDLVTETIRAYAFENEISDGFLLAGPQRQVSSSMYAAAAAWSAGHESDEEQMYEDFGVDEPHKLDGAPLRERLRRGVLPQIDLSQLYQNDSKYNAFRNVVLNYLEDNPKEKIIVFSFYRKTLYYLQERLKKDGVTAQVLVGGMNIPKKEAIENFKTNPGISVLLSSEVAAEGVDLQFSKVLVNYDLPWNPMKVEQRIGRIDRIGQAAEKISIVNILLENTIDQRIHDRLYERLKIFERALGGMEAVLGEEIKSLTTDLLTRPLTPEQERARIEQTAIAVENRKLKEEELEKSASELLAHGNYILEKVDAAHNFKKRITDQDLVAYVKDYLDKYCQGFEFSQQVAMEERYRLKLPAKTTAALVEFVTKSKLFGQTRLTSGDSVLCKFSNKVRDPRSSEEVISQFHPLVRFISKELREAETDASFFPLSALQLDADEYFSPGTYIFSCNRWEFSGIKTEEELPVRVFSLNSGEIYDREKSWNLLNAGRVRGSDWLEVASELDTEAVNKAWGVCERALDKDYEEERRQRENENQDRVSFQVESAERHCERQLSSRSETLRAYRDSGNTRMIPALEGQIRKIKERFELQCEQLNRKAVLRSFQKEVCWGVIRVN